MAPDKLRLVLITSDIPLFAPSDFKRYQDIEKENKQEAIRQENLKRIERSNWDRPGKHKLRRGG